MTSTARRPFRSRRCSRASLISACVFQTRAIGARTANSFTSGGSATSDASSVGSHGNSGLWPWHVRQFDKSGRYVKTILPYPPSTDPAKASGMALLDCGDGAFTPANQNSLYPVFYVFGDEGRLTQVIRNLTHNALRHTESGCVLIACRAEGSSAVLEVRDTGEGIPPQDLPYIFARFYRADAARARETVASARGSWLACQRSGTTPERRHPDSPVRCCRR